METKKEKQRKTKNMNRFASKKRSR